jgi:benzoylformate decarboxylase
MAAKRTGHRALVDQLLADGATHLFGNPGTVEQGLLDAVEREPRLDYVLALHESVAVGIADAYARASRRAAFVQLHSGVGLGNAVGTLYQSLRGRTPLVVFAGEAGLAYDAMDAHMAADLVSIARPVTKWATRVVDPGSVLRVVRRAVKVATTPPQGPVFVALPQDVLDAENGEEARPSDRLDTRCAPPAEAIRAVARRLAGAARPMIIVGDGVAASGAQAALARVAELAGADVWGAQSATANMDAAHPLWCGALGRMFGEDSRARTSRADVVLVTGTYLFPEVFPARAGVFAPGAWVAHVDLVADDIAKSFPVDLGLVADPATALGALAEALVLEQSPSQRAAAAGRVEAARGRRGAALDALRAADEAVRARVPLHPAAVMRELGARWRDGLVVFDEALTASPDLVRHVPPRRADGYLQTYGTCLGVGLPGAVGAQLALPDRTVVGFAGDGGAAMSIPALWTAVRHRVPAKLIVLNNARYNVLRANLLRYWSERGIPPHPFPASFDLSAPPLRFADVAGALGMPAARVERLEELGPAFERALGAEGPFLLEVVVSAELPGLPAAGTT